MRYILPFLAITVTAFALKKMWVSANQPPTEIRLVRDYDPESDDWEWSPEDPIDALQQL